MDKNLQYRHMDVRNISEIYISVKGKVFEDAKNSYETFKNFKNLRQKNNQGLWIHLEAYWLHIKFYNRLFKSLFQVFFKTIFTVIAFQS